MIPFSYVPVIVQLSEPGGLCVDPARGQLIVADTNNHAIKLVPLDGVTKPTEVKTTTINK